MKKKRHHHQKRRSRDEVLETRRVFGIISITPGGFGFVTPDDGGKDVFIPPKHLNSAMDGDKVEVGVLEEEPFKGGTTKGPVGRIREIVERGRETMVGELIAGRKVRALSRKVPDDIALVGSAKGAKRGDWVEINLRHDDKARSSEHRGQISSVIGKVGEVEADLQAIIKEYDLPLPYNESDDFAASKLTPHKVDREDLTDRFCVTIDPADAKDYDDAISLEKGANPGELELGVHIADVAAWVRPGSKWDKGAARRAFTSYLPGKTLPMLPRSLTKIMSLTPEGVSPAHSVIFTIDSKSSEIIGYRRCHSEIKITKRLNFDEVQEFIDGNTPDGWDTDFASRLGELVALTRKMRELRAKTEAFLQLATTEVRVLCDEKTHEILGLRREVQTEADQLVEDCMLAANSAVGRELMEKGLPGIYRVHPEPLPEKIEEFTIFATETFGLTPGDLSSRVACNRFLADLADDHRKPVILGAFLRALPRAFYQEKRELHFGLGKNCYSHFTSPIRRYPDLLIHQQLWAQDKGDRTKSIKTFAKLAADCSRKEANNDEAYYAANDRLKLYYLKQKMYSGDMDFHEAMIVKVSSAGLLIDVTDLGVYGFIEREALRGKFRYRKSNSKLFSESGHQEYQCGDYVYVQLERIDFARGKAIFRPVK